MNIHWRKFVGPSMLVLAGLGSGVDAQVVASAPTTQADAAPEAGGIAEIIVTAQRRSESLQRTSIVLDVISAETLARNGITQVADLTRVNPSAQIGVAGPTVQVYIRGVGDFGATANSNPSVALNIDGVYVGRSQSIGSEFYDVERVEILKGPQGTLYGRNASGGALNLLTRRPKLGELSGNASAEYASFDSVTLEGGLNIPIGSTLAARVSGTYVSKGGFTSEGYGDDRHEAGRVKLLWVPNSVVTLLLNASIGHVGGKGPADVLVNDVPGLATKTPFTDVTDPSIRPFLQASIAPTLPPIPGLVDNPHADEGFLDLNFYNVSAQLDADLGFATLTVLPAYRDARMRYTSVSLVRYQVGAGFGAFPAQPETSHQTSVEARLGHESASLKWVVGGYFYNEDQASQFVSRQGLLSSNAEIFTLGTRSYAAFGQATYSIASALRVIGGLRYTSDQRSIAGTLVGYAPSLGCPLAPGSTCPVESYAGDKTFSNLSWKGGVEADLAPQSLFFATVSSGFKGGGFNRTTQAGAPANSTAAQTFLPEKLVAYEVGLKNRFFDNRLQVNLEAFYWDYKNHQEATVQIDGRGTPALTIVNAGKARQYGGSFDIVARPWNNGTFTAAVEYDNSKFLEFTTYRPAAFVFPNATACRVGPSTLPPNPAFGPILARDCSGFELTRAPKFVGSAGYTHVIQLGSSGQIEANGSLQFASARWLAPDFLQTERAPSYLTVNAALTYTTSNQMLTVTGFIRNITNEAVYSGGFQAPFQPTAIVATIAPPRNYGIRVGLRF